MLIDYSRVSTNDQSLYSQVDKLKQYGCEKIFTYVASGAKSERNGFSDMLEYTRNGDTYEVLNL